MSDDLELDVNETSETPAIEQEVAAAAETTEDLGALKRALEHEREERRQAKEELRRIREDEDYRTNFFKELGYEFAEDEGDEETSVEDDLFEDPIAPIRNEIEPIKKWVEQEQHRQVVAAFDKAVDELSDGSDWELEQNDREWIWQRASQAEKGLSRESVKSAHDELIARYERIAESAVERAKKPKPKASSVTPAGKAATEARDLDSHNERVGFMLERLQGGPNT